MLYPDVFFGTPDFAVSTLELFVARGIPPRLIVTRPDQPAGRNLPLSPSPVKRFALAHAIPVIQPDTLRQLPDSLSDRLAQSDCAVVVAYGRLLPREVLTAPRYGCLNLHASLLPRWRGAAPVQHAILAGDRLTGVDIMQMDSGLDTGSLLARREVAITDQHTGGSLASDLAAAGAELLLETLRNYHTITPRQQPQQGVCYAAKITKQQARIDWQDDAVTIFRQVRAFCPSPVSWCMLGDTSDTRLRLWSAQDLAGSYPPIVPGTLVQVAAQGIDVACGKRGDQRLRMKKIQLPGGKAVSVARLLQSHSAMFPVNLRFE